MLRDLREQSELGGLDFIEIRKDLDIEAAVRERQKLGQKLFVAAGGDGTIHHVLQPLVHSTSVLGVVPVGTWNHFARDLGIPLDWRAALDIALGGASRQIDIGKVNDRFFANNISLGLYPEAVQHRENVRFHWSKWTAYPYATYLTLKEFPHVSLVVEAPNFSQAIKTHVFMVSANPYDLSRVGLVAPRTSMEAGRLSVYWLPHVPKLEFIKALARYVRGRMDAVEGFRSMQTTHLKVQASRSSLKVGMDGELFEMKPPLAISIEPQSLLVRVPRP